MYNTSYMEDFVQELYLKINITQPQQLEIGVIAERLNILLFYWDNPSRALFFKSTPYIFLNKYISNQQKFQDFCHELAHVLMHSGHQNRLPPLFIEYQEWKANNFMYHACIPTFMLNELAINDCTTQTIRRIQELFCVEYDFALKRINQYLCNRIVQMAYTNANLTRQISENK